MVREKKVDSTVVAPVVTPEPSVPVANPYVASVPVVREVSAPVANNTPEKLSEVDRLNLDLSRCKRQIALAEAKTALANNENAELNYKYLVLQIYLKYGLSTEDAISEAGDIVRGGAVQRPQGQ